MVRIIREITRGDIQQIEDIYALYWPDDDFRKKLCSRLQGYIEQNQEILRQKFLYLVAEESEEVVGVIGMRAILEHMRGFASTSNPAELYILAVKNRRVGVGRALVEKAMEVAKNKGYTELVVYSGETHNESWGFYDHMGFKCVGDAIAPNGEPGKIWRLKL